MKLDVTTLDGESGRLGRTVRRRSSASSRAQDLIQRMVRWQLAKRRAGTHKAKGRAEIARTGKKLYKQKGTGGARHGSARAPQFRGGGRAFGPVVRGHAHDLPKKVRALACAMRCRPRPRTAASSSSTRRRWPIPRRRRCVEQFGKLGLEQRADHRRRRGRTRTSRSPPATSRTSTCCRSRASTSTTSCAARRSS